MTRGAFNPASEGTVAGALGIEPEPEMRQAFKRWREEGSQGAIVEGRLAVPWPRLSEGDAG